MAPPFFVTLEEHMDEDPEINPIFHFLFLIFLLGLTALAGWIAIQFITWLDHITGANAIAS